MNRQLIETYDVALLGKSIPVPYDLISKIKNSLLMPMLTTLKKSAQGLAHVQLNKEGWEDTNNYRAFALRRNNGTIKVFINPVMKIDGENSTSYTHTEQCLSIVKYKMGKPAGLEDYNILRYPAVRLWDDFNDEKVYHGIEAACIQHEMDHLNGILLRKNGLLLDDRGDVDKSNW